MLKLSGRAYRFSLLLPILLVLTSTPAGALTINLGPPAEGEFVRDLADLITPGDEERIRNVASRVLGDAETPIIVVTITSMADHGGADLRIETFATLLFDQWGVGRERAGGRDWNTGVLLLVSRDDRKARIELGKGWRRDYDRQASRVMERQIVPRFKGGDFSGGIVAGVEALDGMARALARELREQRAAAAMDPPIAPDPQRQPVERPDPWWKPESADAAAAPPPPAPQPDSARPPQRRTLPPEQFPGAPPPAARGPVLFDDAPARHGSSWAAVGGFTCVGLLLFLIVAAVVIASLVRRGMNSLGYAAGHHAAAGLGNVLGAFGRGGGGGSPGRGRFYDNEGDTFFTTSRRRRSASGGFGGIGGGIGGGFGPSSRRSSGSIFSGSSSRPSSSSSRSGSSSSGPRSFGGGSSGGGGATGSW